MPCLTDEGGVALWALPAPLGEVTGDVAVQVLLRFKGGAARKALEVLENTNRKQKCS